MYFRFQERIKLLEERFSKINSKSILAERCWWLWEKEQTKPCEMTDEQHDEDAWTLLTELTYFYQFTAEFLEYTICQMEN